MSLDKGWQTTGLFTTTPVPMSDIINRSQSLPADPTHDLDPRHDHRLFLNTLLQQQSLPINQAWVLRKKNYHLYIRTSEQRIGNFTKQDQRTKAEPYNNRRDARIKTAAFWSLPSAISGVSPPSNSTG